MTGARSLEIELLPGAAELLARHARALPQRDDLCGAFCGALALAAAGVTAAGGGELDQDAVAVAAGSVVSAIRDPGTLPFGETGRRDYTLAVPVVDDPAISGTTAGGVVRVIAELSAGALEPIPLAGPWSAAALDGLFERTCAFDGPVTLVANLATRHLWGARATVAQLLAHLLEGVEDGPAPDWDVGHFACIVGRVRGPRGSLYALADTYPALGAGGVHAQPAGRLATAIERRDMPSGGVIAVVRAAEAGRLRGVAAELGLREEIWDNGTVGAGARP